MKFYCISLHAQFNTVYVLYSLMKQMWCSRIEHAHVDKGRKNWKEICLARLSKNISVMVYLVVCFPLGLRP